MLVFVNDIPVFSANRYEHKENFKTVLEVLGEKQLFAKHRKCAFWVEAVSCLVHDLSKDDNAWDPIKIEALVE